MKPKKKSDTISQGNLKNKNIEEKLNLDENINSENAVVSSSQLRDFYNKVGELYPEEDLVYRSPSGILRQKFVKKLLKKYSGNPHLDIGCGGGVYLEGFKGTCIGVDIALPVLKRARAVNPECFFLVADAKELTFFKEKTFESILLSEVIEHFENPELFFEGAFRLLKDDGLLIITTPNYRGKKPEIISTDVLKDYGIKDDFYLHTAYRPAELAKMAKDAGFNIVDKGTLEKELRYWYRGVSELILLTKYIFGKKTAIRISDLFRNLFFRVFQFTGILWIVKKIVSEGSRTYLVARKS